MLSNLKHLLSAFFTFLIISIPVAGQDIDYADNSPFTDATSKCPDICMKNERQHVQLKSEVIASPYGINSSEDLRQNNPSTDQTYAFSISYIHDEFSEYFDAWNSGFLQLSRVTSIGTLIGRVNMADRFDNSGVQPEIDFYPAFSEHSYGYFNFGISSNRIFPDYRFGAELYHGLPKGFEISAGLRYLRYPANELTIYTGSLTSYLGNWMITARPYFTPVDEGVSRSAALFIRKYFADADHYFTLRSGYGFSPEERTFQFGLDEIYLSKSGFIGLEGQTSISQNLFGFAILDFSRQEAVFEPDNFYTRLTLQVRFEYRF